MDRTLPSDRHAAAVRATLNLDTAPRAMYLPGIERVVVKAGAAAVQLSPRVAREFVDSLMGAVDAAEGYWEPDQAHAALDTGGTARDV